MHWVKQRERERLSGEIAVSLIGQRDLAVIAWRVGRGRRGDAYLVTHVVKCARSPVYVSAFPWVFVVCGWFMWTVRERRRL